VLKRQLINNLFNFSIREAQYWDKKSGFSYFDVKDESEAVEDWEAECD